MAAIDIQKLNDEITRLTLEIETVAIPKLPDTNDTRVILEEINKLKMSKKETWLNRVADLSSIIGILRQLMPPNL